MKPLIYAAVVGLLFIPLLLMFHIVYSDVELNYWTYNMTGITIQEALDNRNSKSDSKSDTQMSLSYLTKEDTTVAIKPPVATTKHPVVTTKPPVVSKPVANITHTFRPYAISSSYWEQQSNAILNMFSLQRWANSLGLTVVEPFVCQSELKFPPIVLYNNTLTNTLRLRDYIDLKYWDARAKESGILPLETWENFVLYSAKKIILVILPYSGPGGTYANDKIKTHPECLEKMSKFYDSHGKLFHSLQFEVIRNVCISFYKYIIPPEIFNAGLQVVNNKGATIWITEWQGVENGRVAFTGLGHNKFARTLLGEQRYLGMIKPSSRLLKDSQRYVSEVLGVQFNQFDAVVARNKPLDDRRTGEWYVQHFNTCVSQLEKYTKSGKNKLFLAIDMGRFGDRVRANKFDYNSQGKYTGNGHYLYKRYLSVAYGNKSIDSYENDFVRVTNGIVDTGYIGALQRTIALHANVVYLVGGHSTFQGIIMQHFYEQKKSNAIIKICFK